MREDLGYAQEEKILPAVVLRFADTYGNVVEESGPAADAASIGHGDEGGGIGYLAECLF